MEAQDPNRHNGSMEGLKANASSYAVVGALFATVTYAAHVMPPGGMKGSNTYSIAAFYVFFYSNYLSFLFSVGLLAAFLMLTASIDRATGFPENYRWERMACNLQWLAIPMYATSIAASIAASFITFDVNGCEKAHAIVTIFLALGVLILTVMTVYCISKSWKDASVNLFCYKNCCGGQNPTVELISR